jgi:hypothetical protein
MCESGKYSNSNGSSACSLCTLHTTSSAASVSAEDCLCDRGLTMVTTSRVCQSCAVGKYKNESGNQDCSDCPHGAFSLASSSELVDCRCMLGYTGPDGGPCKTCVPGTYKHVNGTASCRLCSAGKYSTETGQVSEVMCRSCPSHTYSGEGSNMLTNCTCNVGYTGPNGQECFANFTSCGLECLQHSADWICNTTCGDGLRAGVMPITPNRAT